MEELQACASPGGGADVWKLKLDFADFISEKSHFSDHLVPRGLGSDIGGILEMGLT